MRTLARWRFAPDDLVPLYIVWFGSFGRRRRLLSLLGDALAQAIICEGQHGSRNAKVVST